MTEPLHINKSTTVDHLKQFTSQMQAGEKLRATYDKATDSYTLYTSNKGSGTGLKNFLFKSVDKKQATAQEALVRILHNTPRTLMATDAGRFKLTSAMVWTKTTQFERHTGDVMKRDLQQLGDRWRVDIARAKRDENDELNPPPTTNANQPKTTAPTTQPGPTSSPSAPPAFTVADLMSGNVTQDQIAAMLKRNGGA